MRSFPPPPGRDRRRRIVARLLVWYRAHARDLPWRRTRDPYAIWISEAMLQQTRVEAVVDYWRAFLRRFPTVQALAGASEDEVLAAWSGLGYYRRARALHAAARAIVAEHGGRFPRERPAALALPGVGPYTAGAVLSIAYDRPTPLVDGNVERVFSRLFGLDARSGSGALTRETWSLAALLVPRAGGAGEWNQALMELGAVVCTPRAPLCADCPVRRSCAARRTGRVEHLPRPRHREPPVDVKLEMLSAVRGGRRVLEQRPDTGRMAGMWQLPTVEGPGPEGRHTGLFPSAWPAGAQVEPGGELFDLRHGITRHRIRATVRGARVRRTPPAWRWVEPRALAGLALTGLTRKALSRLQPSAPAADRR